MLKCPLLPFSPLPSLFLCSSSFIFFCPHWSSSNKKQTNLQKQIEDLRAKLAKDKPLALLELPVHPVTLTPPTSYYCAEKGSGKWLISCFEYPIMRKSKIKKMYCCKTGPPGWIACNQVLEGSRGLRLVLFLFKESVGICTYVLGSHGWLLAIPSELGYFQKWLVMLSGSGIPWSSPI